MEELSEFQRLCKENLDVVLAAANGEEIQYFNQRGAWMSKTGGNLNAGVKYRIKPRTITVNGFEVPEPVTDKWWEMSGGYISDVTRCDFFVFTTCDQGREIAGKRGILHTTKEAAIAHAKAMLGIDPNGSEE